MSRGQKFSFFRQGGVHGGDPNIHRVNQLGSADGGEVLNKDLFVDNLNRNIVKLRGKLRLGSIFTKC